MGVFYMKHLKYGTKVAIEEAEVEHDKKRGWVEFDPTATAAEPVKPESKPVPAAKTVQNAGI